MSIDNLPPEEARHLFRVWDGEKMWGPENMEFGVGKASSGSIFYANFCDGGKKHLFTKHLPKGHHLTKLNCTGLRDNQCVYIFEGDVVSIEGTPVARKVTWSPFGYQLRAVDPRGSIRLSESVIDLITIIGNIYENPELPREVENG